MDAIRILAGRGRTNLALAVHEGLKLLDDEENIRPYQLRKEAIATRYMFLKTAAAPHTGSRGPVEHTRPKSA